MSASREKRLRQQQKATNTGSPKKKKEWETRALRALVIGIALVMVFFLVLNSGLVERNINAVSVNNQRLTIADYNFSLVLQAETALRNQGSAATLDQPLDGQPGVPAGFADHIYNQHRQQLHFTLLLNYMAQEHGITLSEDNIALVEADMDLWNAQIRDSGRSSSSYHRNRFGRGVDASTVRRYFERVTLARQFQEYWRTNIAVITDDAILEHYEENSADYDAVDFMWLSIPGERQLFRDLDTRPAPAEGEDPLPDLSDAQRNALRDAAVESAIRAGEVVKVRIENADDFRQAFLDEAYRLWLLENAEDDDEDNGDNGTTATDDEEDEEEAVFDPDDHVFEGFMQRSITMPGTDTVEVPDAAEGQPDTRQRRISEWLFTEGARYGNIQVFTDVTADATGVTVNTFIVMFVDRHQQTETAYANLRVITVGPDLNPEAVATEEQMDVARAEAEAIMTLWSAGEQSEAAFEALAREHTQNVPDRFTGGLRENMPLIRDSEQPVNDWIADEASRNAGDVGKFQVYDNDGNANGFAIVYFINYADMELWQFLSRGTLLNEAFTDMIEEELDDTPIRMPGFWARRFVRSL